MKKLLFFSVLAGLFLSGCSNDEFIGKVGNGSATNNEIGFAMSVPNLTRATTGGSDAAQKLNNNFVVYGFKWFGASGDAEPFSATDVVNPEKQQNVFTRYNVNYIGNAGTTQTNTKGWEYVGYTDLQGDLQTRKFWDYSANGYVFSAISGVNVKAEKIASGEAVYDKGWKVTIPAGGSLSALYASNRVPVAKKANSSKVYEYPENVDLTFYAVGAKVRFGIYETVSGYSVKIDKFYCKDKDGKFTASSNTTTNFGINGKFLTPKVNNPTELTITYYDNNSGIENHPKVSFEAFEPDNKYSALFGSNMQATAAIGETSSSATYDKAKGEYTFILPYQNTGNELKLYVDFTLTAPNSETIKVKQARAIVPADYTQWKENFAYTYLFKISDNTNGSTGTPKDPDDPEKPWEDENHDPEGLYTITFDACVVNAEDGIQETVTTTTTPSITTYAKGVNATANADYAAGDVYYNAATTNASGDAEFISTAKSAVYEVVYSGTAAVTEQLVANYANDNGVILVPVKTTAATEVPLSDGSKLTFSANQCNKFTAASGKKYAIIYTDASGAMTIKVVSVSGDPAATVTYGIVMKSAGQTIAKTSDEAEFKLVNTNGTYGVANANIMGAATFFEVYKGAVDVTESFAITAGNNASGDANYHVSLTDAAIAAGIASGDYTVKYDAGEGTFKVNTTYSVTYASGDAAIIVSGGTGETVTLKVNGTVYEGAVITEKPEGINVTDNNGIYAIDADKAVASGDYTLKIAGQTVNVKVISYSLLAGTVKEKTVTWYETMPAASADALLAVDIQLYMNGTTCAKAVSIASSNTAVTASGDADATGKFTVKPKAGCNGGTAELTYENATFKYTVNRYELKSGVSAIKKATESTKLTFWLNEVQQNAAIATVTVKKQSGANWIVKTDGFSLTTDGRDLTFGNVTAAGTYKIEYYATDSTTVLGEEIITVTE